MNRLRPSRIRATTWLLGLSIAGLADPSTAQTVHTLRGRVIEAGQANKVQNASVVLEGHGATLTSSEGAFEFTGVISGEYLLRVDAFGYAPTSLRLLVEGDSTVTVELDIAPLLVDSLVAELTEIEVAGRLLDGSQDTPLTGVDILTSQGSSTLTNVRGRFDLEVWEGVPLLVGVRAFGYLPLDTLVTPAEDDSYLLQVAPDPIVRRMIDTQVAVLDDRAGGRIATLMRPLNRDQLLRWTGATVRDVLRAEYPQLRRRIRCAVVDEKVLAGMTIGAVLGSTFVDEVERMEFLFSGAMLRVYTREFIRRMVAGSVALSQPVYVDMARPPVCL